MTDAIVDQIADAIIADLNAQTFSKTCTFAVHDHPELMIENIERTAGVVGYIVPEGWDEGAELSRDRCGIDEYGLFLVIAKKLESDDGDNRTAGTDQTERRALRYFVQEVRQRLKGRRVTCADGDSALWMRAGNVAKNGDMWPLFKKDAIAKPGLFMSGTFLVYAV